MQSPPEVAIVIPAYNAARFLERSLPVTREIAADAQVLVVDAGYGLGNGRILPAGPLRETPAQAVARTTAVIHIADPAAGIPSAPRSLSGVPVLDAYLAPAPGTALTRMRLF